MNQKNIRELNRNLPRISRSLPEFFLKTDNLFKKYLTTTYNDKHT